MKKFSVIFIYAVLALGTLGIFWQVRSFDFVNYDDNSYVTENQQVLNGLSLEGIKWAFTTGNSANWHPLTWLSLMLDCQLFGKDSGWMHFMNLIFHILNTLLVFAVFKKMTGRIWASAFIAALFSIHPMHVESVAWVAERKDVLSAFFMLVTLWAYAWYVKERKAIKYIVTLIFFIFGLLSKPMLVTVPFLLLLLDYWPLERITFEGMKIPGKESKKKSAVQKKQETWQKLLIEKIPFFTAVCISSVVTFLVQRAGGAMSDTNHFSLKSRFYNAVLAYIRYIGKMIWPMEPAAFYPLNVNVIRIWQVAGCILLLLMITAGAIYFAKKRKYLPVGWFWFAGMLVPVIGIVQVGEQSMADRYTYIPYIGLFVIVTWSTAELVSKLKGQKILLSITAAAVLGVMGMVTYKQAGYWKDSVTLFKRTIEVTKNNYVIYNYLGVVYGNAGRWQDEKAVCREAIRIAPGYAKAHHNLGVAYNGLGKYQEAIREYELAARLMPNYAETFFNMGVAYCNLDRFQEGIEKYKQTLSLKKDHAEAANNLGAAYASLGQADKAIDSFKLAIAIKPDSVNAYNNLALVYSNVNMINEEIETYKRAIAIQPDNAKTNYDLGVAYRQQGRFAEAIECWKQAIRFKGDYVEAYNDIGTAMGILGDNKQAIETFKQALKLQPVFAEAHYNLGYAYLMAGEKELAFEEYKFLKDLSPEHAKKLFPNGLPMNTK